MTVAASPVSGRNFRLALCQIAQPGDGTNKQDNLAHAREMVSQAVKGGQEGKKPDLVVLPVSSRKLSSLCFEFSIIQGGALMHS